MVSLGTRDNSSRTADGYNNDENNQKRHGGGMIIIIFILASALLFSNIMRMGPAPLSVSTVMMNRSMEENKQHQENQPQPQPQRQAPLEEEEAEIVLLPNVTFLEQRLQELENKVQQFAPKEKRIQELEGKVKQIATKNEQLLKSQTQSQNHATTLKENIQTLKQDLNEKIGLLQELAMPRVRFIPFPHKHLGMGLDAACKWITLDADSSLANQLLGKHASIENNSSVSLQPSSEAKKVMPDKIQMAALREGLCLSPKYATTTIATSNEDTISRMQRPPLLHLFSTAEARACLSQSKVTIVVSGDSYNRQLFIGLVDILSSRASDFQIPNADIRWKVLEESIQELEDISIFDVTKNNPDHPFKYAIWACTTECYGELGYKFSIACPRCIRKVRRKHPDRIIVPVVGAMIHIYHGFHKNITETLRTLEAFAHQSHATIFNSQPAYHSELIPKEFQNGMTDTKEVYYRFIQRWHLFSKNVQFLDFFQSTGSCTWENCSYDGGHRSRFVNRWKAQLLLNTICDYS